MNLSRRFRDPRLLISGGFLVLVGVAALFGPLVTADPAAIRAGKQLLPPGTEGLLGTDEFGRDLLSRVVHGGRLSLSVGLGSTALAALIGTIAGMWAAYRGGWLDTVIMRSSDFVLAFPPILFAIFTVSFLGSSVTNLILVVALLFTPRFTRIAHSATLVVREKAFVESSRVVGSSTARILRRVVFPSISGLLLVHVSLTIGQAIIIETGLSFLGLGPPPSVPSWGRTIHTGSRFMGLSPYGVLWPSIAISLTIISFNLFGDALRDRLDPALQRLPGARGSADLSNVAGGPA